MQVKEKIIQKPPHEDQIMKGIVYVCIAFFSFAIMHAFNKMLTGQHHVIEIAFYRSIISMLPCIVYIVATKKYDLLKTDMPIALMFRVIIGTLGLILTFSAVQHLPLSYATVLFFFSTLLIPILSVFILKEYIGMHRWIAVAIGMTGVILVAQPKGDVTLIGIVLALSAAVIHAIIQVLLRAMKGVNSFTITFYFFLGGMILTGIFMPFVMTMPSTHNMLILLCIGISGGIGQYFLTRGFQLAPASLLGPFNYTGLIWATGLDILIWNYIPGWPVFLGGAIIIASKFYIIHREKLSARK
ncbi:MAG: DMT family transporter [Alphaproteobacteria bacterium]|nr:DMT family transporter [Alphaproteobacteria bacterium]